MRLAIIIISLLFSSFVFAQKDSTYTLKDVIVSGTRSGFAESGNRSVQVIYADEIMRLPATNLPEILELISSVDVRSRGPVNVQSDISTRGGSFEQTLVLLNGVPLTDPQTGHHMMNIPIAPSDIDRIEILSGAASRIFGPKAFSGAINIITKKAQETSGTISATGGENGLYDLAANASSRIKRHGINVSGGYTSSDGYITNTDAKNHYITAQWDATWKDFTCKVFGGLINKQFGAQNFYTASFPDQFEITQAKFTEAVANYTKGSWAVSGRFYIRQHDDQFQLFREGPGWYVRNHGMFIMDTDTAPSWYKGHNYHRTNVQGGDVNIAYSWKSHTFSLGTSYRSEKIQSNILGEPISPSIQVPGEPSYAKFLREASRDEMNFFVEDRWQKNNWTISGGLLLATSSNYDTQLFPGAEISYTVNKHIRMYSNLNMAVRYPTYTDLYYSLGGAKGSKDLNPEQSVSYELGTRYNNLYWSGQIAVFRREGKDLIDWIRMSGENVTKAANITEVNFSGVDLHAQLNSKELFGDDFIFSSMQFSYSWLTSDTASAGFESNYVLDYLRHKFTFLLVQPLSPTLSFSWGLNLQDRVGGYRKPGESIETQYPTFFTADVRLLHQGKNARFFVDINNLFNRQYVDFGNVQQPGRWIKAGMSFTLVKSKQKM
jgi:vitamin B12 transporter